jgi:site-specific DNA recombinase
VLGQAAVAETLKRVLHIIENCYEAYRRAPDQTRRLLNQAIFHKIFVDVEADLRIELASPFKEVLSLSRVHRSRIVGLEILGKKDEPRPEFFSGQGSNELHMVELRGFEPLTPCMPCRCATNCATAPFMSPPGLSPGPKQLA